MSATRLVAVLVGTMAVTACAPARLAVPETLGRDVAPLKVEKKYRHLLSSEGTLAAGEYLAAFDEDSARRSGIGFGQVEVCRGKRDYRFALASPGRAQPLKVECEERMSGQQATFAMLGGNLTVGDAEKRVSCRLVGSAGHATFQQTSGPDLRGVKRVEGQVAVGAVSLSAESLGRETQGALSMPYLGFQLRRAGEVVGLVQTQGPMQLWLSPALRTEEREAAVLGAFTLLLQRTWTHEGVRDCEQQA